MHLFGRQPSGVFEGLADVLLLELGMVRENLLGARSVRERADDDRDPHAQSMDTRAFTLDLACRAISTRAHPADVQRGEALTICFYGKHIGCRGNN